MQRTDVVTRRLALVCLALSLATGCRPVVESMAIVGTIAAPPSVIGRDGGLSAPVQNEVLWLFGDTILNPPACDGTGLLSSTAALGTPASITAVTEPIDACGAPSALISPGVPATATGARTAFWPGAVAPTIDGRAAVWFDQVLLDGDVWTRKESAVGEVEPGSTVLDRTKATTLFGMDEPGYTSGALVDSGFIYLYDTINLPDYRTAYTVARVPQADYRQRSAYTFWDGSAWVPQISAAATVVLRGADADASGGLGGMTVSYNPWLRAFLMVHSEAFKHDLMLRTAPRPEGPWSEPAHVQVPPGTGSVFGSYSAREHPEYRSVDGRTVYITYSRATGPLSGQLPVVQVTFK